MHNPDVPEVYATADATVVLDLQPEHAQALAHILQHYDALVGGGASAFTDYVPEVWHHVMIQLHSQRALACGRVAELAMLDATADPRAIGAGQPHQPRHLALVGDVQ